jgi:hypothetical protein
MDIIKILFPSLDKNILKSKYTNIDVENVFPSKYQAHRRADLVVTHNGKHKALLEIKYKDKSGPYQISDYLDYSEKNNLCFTYLTQYNPSEDDLNEINTRKNKNYSYISYNTLYEEVKKSSKPNKPLTKLFIKFMEEEYMVYNEELNENALKLLMLKGLYVKHSHGFSRIVSNDNFKSISSLWDTLINNVGILGGRFYNDFYTYFNKSFSLDFAFDPEFNYKTLKKDIDCYLKENDRCSKNREHYETLNRNRKTGGSFWIASVGIIKLNNKHKLTLYIGYLFYIDLNDKENKKVFKELYCEIWNKNEQVAYNYKSINSKKGKFPSENTCHHQLLILFENSINAILKKQDIADISLNKLLKNIKTAKNS